LRLIPKAVEAGLASGLGGDEVWRLHPGGQERDADIEEDRCPLRHKQNLYARKWTAKAFSGPHPIKHFQYQ